MRFQNIFANICTNNSCYITKIFLKSIAIKNDIATIKILYETSIEYTELYQYGGIL